MKKIILGIVFALAASSANANFFDSNNGEWKMGPYGPYYDESDWPEWTPMYWMEKFMDEMDDDNNGYYPMMRYQQPMPQAQSNYAQPAMPAPQAPFPPVAPAPTTK